jgi:predicted transcriptional regulator
MSKISESTLSKVGHKHRYKRLHKIKVTVESSESEENGTVARQQHMQKIKNFTAKRNRRKEEAATRNYVYRDFIMTANV